MRKKIILSLLIFSAGTALKSMGQEDSIRITKKSNVLMIGIQPTSFRLNYYDPNFFNNPNFKTGIDFCFQYGRIFLKNWMAKAGADFSLSSGEYYIGKLSDRKYIDELFLRVPVTFVKKFPIDCNDCFMNPSLFVELGGYVSISLYQSTYVQDASTGLSSRDLNEGFGYMKVGIAGGLGLSFLSNNFGRHVIGIRIYKDLLEAIELKNNNTTNFQPSYSGIALFYNIANISW